MRKNNRGFTVVELIVSIALLALILVPTAGFFTNSFKIQGRTSMKTSITRVGQHIMESFKNKDYLNLEVNGYEFESYVQAAINDGSVSSFSSNKITGEDGWETEYKDVLYNVQITLTGYKEMNMENLDDIPTSATDCVASITINADGTFESGTSAWCTVTPVNEGEKFDSPNDAVNEKLYTASCPTFILTGLNGEFEKASLWIDNQCDSDDKWKLLRIVKGFDEELHVYVSGKSNISILKGQEGDGASRARTSIIKHDIRNMTNGNNKDVSSSEILFDAEMVITSTSDDTISDTFKFSFPVNCKYPENDSGE